MAKKIGTSIAILLGILGAIGSWAVFNLSRLGIEKVLIRFGINTPALQYTFILVFVIIIFGIVYGLRKGISKFFGN